MAYPIFLVGICAFLFSIVLTPACRDLFRRWGLVDKPDDSRKLHTAPVPHMGGVPIALSYLASCLLLAVFPIRGALAIDWWQVLRVFPAILIIFTTGVLDDILHLKPWQKLAGQLMGALWAYWAGVRIASVSGYNIDHWSGVIVTVVWLIGCTNAFNLIDGVDGVASGVGVFATATMLIAAALQNNFVFAMAIAPLLGALLGFLRYNFNPASIFLGDSGSLMIGFLLGCFGVVWSQKAATVLGMTAPLMALGIPILDTALSIMRRFLRHQPIFGADRDHIHHRLLKRGFTPRRVALLLYAVAGVGAGLSLLLQRADISHLGGAVIVLFCLAAWFGIKHLGYTEFATARRMLLAGTFQQTLDAQLRLGSFEQVLASSTSIEQCWEKILEGARTFDFVEVRMRFADIIYQKCLRDSDDDLRWTLRVSLPGNNYINFTRSHDSTVFSMGVAPFIDMVRRTMSAKCQEFGSDKIVAAGARFD